MTGGTAAADAALFFWLLVGTYWQVFPVTRQQPIRTPADT
jgi:hypothetical protein